jgi:DNA helicase-2/ATP-dependent DNA helicase PcrA
MELDKAQQEIVNSNSENIIVAAGAGSGKTRTLTERVRKLLKDGVDPSGIVVITFTNEAADELKNRLSNTPSSKKCFIGTIHAYANKLLKRTGYNFKIFDEEHQTQFMLYLIENYARYAKPFDYYDFLKYDKMVASGRMSKSQVSSKFSSDEVYHELMQFMNREYSTYPETVRSLCKENNVITFDELIELSTRYFEESKITLEYLFVDELQDIGYLEYNFLMALNAKNNFMIGDDYQCQPEGTKVLMEDGSLKNIEDIVVGDKVVSYSTDIYKYFSYRKLSSRRSRGKDIMDIQKSVSNKLIDIETNDGHKSTYTPNHKCLVRIDCTDTTSDMYCGCLFEDDNGNFRIGCSKFFLKSNKNYITSGIRKHINSNSIKNVWVLKMCKTKKDADYFKDLCSCVFGITMTQHSYDDDSYKMLLGESKVSIQNKVIKCLDYFNRSIDYPFMSKDDDNKFMIRGNIIEVQACNLIPELMSVIIPEKDDDNNYTNRYNTIKSIEYRTGDFNVYSLKVDDTETYIADGILTHNSIYAFKGGDVKIFLSLINNDNWKTYYLIDNYRTCKSVLRYANTIIQNADDIIKKKIGYKNENNGRLEFITKSKLSEFLNGLSENEDWFILTRNNKEACHVDDILTQAKIRHYCIKRSNTTTSNFKNICNNKCIKVMTVHASKGLECDNVAIYGKFPVKGKGQSDELKVYYVGLTRAKNRCVVFI